MVWQRCSLPCASSPRLNRHVRKRTCCQAAAFAPANREPIPFILTQDYIGGHSPKCQLVSIFGPLIQVTYLKTFRSPAHSANRRYEALVPRSAEPVEQHRSMISRLKSSAHTGFGAFKSALRIAKESSDFNPVVKSVLGGVLALLDYFDVSLGHH